MRVDRPPLAVAQAVFLVHDVEQCFVDLADVVKERDALDRALARAHRARPLGDDQGVGRDSADVHAGLCVIGLDGVEQRLERGGGESLDRTVRLAFARDERASGDGAEEQWDSSVHSALRCKKGARRRRAPSIQRPWILKAQRPPGGCQGGVAKRCRRRPTLPRSRERSTIGAVGLNDRVRNGNECGPYALVASDSSGLGAWSRGRRKESYDNSSESLVPRA